MILHLVNGPPGCGKTTYLSRQCEVAAKKYGGERVVVGSLTRAAAAEVAGRKTPLPRANVATMHSHAYHALQRPAMMETKEGLDEWNEWVGIASMRISNKHAVDPENASAEAAVFDTDGIEALNRANVLRQRMTPVEAWPPSVQRFWRKWLQFKLEHARLDFTDLIEQAYERVDKLPQDPVVFMLDEAQDMSRLEFALAMKWGAHCDQVVIVGDQDQNLYQWRGTDPHAFTDHDATTVRTLSQSYRVPAAVHAVAVKWITQIEDRMPTEYEPRKDDEGVPVEGVCRKEALTWRDPMPLLQELTARVEERDATIMVLATCGYMLNPLLAEMRKYGVPFHNPYRVKAGNWNPMKGAARVLAFVRPRPRSQGGEAEMWTWKDLKKWIDPMQAKGILTRGAKTFIEAKCLEDKFGDGKGNDAVTMEDVLGLFLSEDSVSHALDGDIDWWEECLKHDDRKRQQYALTVARKRGFDALREVPSIMVGTIHSVKGGEADCVYLMPDLSSTAYFGAWQRGDRDPTIRQFYVGMTRAREELVLCSASGPERVMWL